MVDIFKRKALHLIKNVVAQILRVAGPRLGAELSGQRAEHQSQHGYQSHENAHPDHIAEILSLDSLIDDLRHLKGNQDLHEHLKNYEQRC